jgi:hypothetical protein
MNGLRKQSYTALEGTGVTSHIIGSPVAALECRPHSSPAAALGPIERRDLALEVLAGNRPVTELAEEHDVSRKFLYQQANTARQALERAFSPRCTEG